MAKKKRKIKPKPAYGDDHQLAYLHAFGIDRPKRELWLVGEPRQPDCEDDGEPGVEYNMATKLLKNLHILEGDNNNGVTIHMKTCGGWVEEGFAIIDALRTSTCPIMIINYSHARSMSSMIFESADMRAMMPSSCFMFHRGSMWVGGTNQEVYTNVEWSKRYDKLMLDIYVRAMKDTEHGKFHKWSEKRIREMLVDEMNKKTDVFLDAQETVDWGLADCIIEVAESVVREK